jgi:Tfp pilus assembly protein PilN
VRPLKLDFLKDGRAARGMGAALLALGLAIAAAAAAEYILVSEKIAKAQSSLRTSGNAIRAKPLPQRQKGDPKKIAVEFQQAQVLMERLQLPWDHLFISIESVRDSDVALLSVESDNERRRVKISAEAKDLDAVVRYLAELRQRRTLAEVYLESHELQLKDPQRPVRFVLGARWSAQR